jgi:hypothetical protein
MDTAPSELHYVVLRHEGIPEPHFDVMLEIAPGSALKTFRSPSWPPPMGRTMKCLPDHRREYLKYEGPISGDRGFVRRVVMGTCTVETIAKAGVIVDFDDGTSLLVDAFGAHRAR